jgi:hypothetical protein
MNPLNSLYIFIYNPKDFSNRGDFVCRLCDYVEDDYKLDYEKWQSRYFSRYNCNSRNTIFVLPL